MPDSREGSVPRAEDVFDDYLRRVESGDVPDADALCRAHPQIAEELARLLRAQVVIERLLPGSLGDAPRTDAPVAPDLVARLRAEAPRGGRLRRGAELGRGGMGTVHRVRDDDLQRDLAMKVLHSRSGAGAPDARSLHRFVSEARITAQLDHPGIVPLHEIGLDADGALYYTMRLIEGEDLRAVFEKVRSGKDGWSRVRALGVVQRVCEAMSYAHSKGVIHRDLKPSNVMVGRYGAIYVVDWGLARVVGEVDPVDLRLRPQTIVPAGSADRVPESPLVTMDGDVLGTAAYMSPEQARGEVDRLGPRSDVYSVGAMLYHFLSGHAPFATTESSDPDLGMVERVRRGPPPPLHQVARDAPAELVAICEKAMARDAGARYADMGALADDLRAYAEGRVVGAYETGAIATLRKWIGRNKALAAALLAIFVGVPAVALFWWTSSREANHNEPLVTSRRLARFLSDASADGPPPTDGRTASAWWFAEAEAFVKGGSSRGVGLATYRKQLAEMRASARPLSPQERVSDERFKEMERTLAIMRADLLWRRRMLGRERFPREEDVEAAMGSETLTSSVDDLNRTAFDLIHPDKVRLFYGQEVRAVVLARRAVGLARGAYWRARTCDTLAWALCRVGAFNEARAREDEAGGAVEQYVAEVAENDRKAALDWRRNITQNRLDQAREQHCWESGEEEERLPMRAAEIEALEHELEGWNRWKAGDAREGLRLEWLEGLVRNLTILERRIAVAREATETTAARARWAEAISRIAAAPKYAGLGRIAPQLDLVPLGFDAASGLAEFAHLPSGLVPKRDAKTGRILLTRNSGLVFVLVPGPPASSAGTRGGVAARPVPPLFVSKYEMTEAQWARLSGASELHEPELRALKPKHTVAWFECGDLLKAAGAWLRLPWAAEWDHAARGGTTTRFWTGDDPSSLEGAANLTFGAPSPKISLFDVGSLKPNPFGIHDVNGNVEEFCQDQIITPSRPSTAEKERGPRIECGRVARSEGPGLPAARAGEVHGHRPTIPLDHLGLRPVRPLLP